MKSVKAALSSLPFPLPISLSFCGNGVSIEVNTTLRGGAFYWMAGSDAWRGLFFAFLVRILALLCLGRPRSPVPLLPHRFTCLYSQSRLASPPSFGHSLPSDHARLTSRYSSCLFRLQLTRFTDDTLHRPFALIESKVRQVSEYVSKWLQFQSLWDLEAESVFARLGDDLALWQQLLSEIKKTRATFDNSDTERSFGVVVVDYEQVQSRVNAKYDSWQRDILGRFGAKLGMAMKEMHSSILKARNELEHHSIEGMIGGGGGGGGGGGAGGMGNGSAVIGGRR